MKRALLVLLGLLGGAFILAGSASAHATVITSDPADGSRLTAAPRTVTITFDESVGLGSVGYLHVTDQTGRRVDAGAATHPGNDGTKVTDTLTSGLGDGTYTASFRVVSADSHPVAGTIRFVVGDGALARGSVGGTSADSATGAVFDGARWVSFAGLALLGGAWLLLTVWPQGRDDRRATAIVRTGWVAAAVGGVLELLLQGPYTAGSGPGGLVDWSLLDSTLHSDYGQLHSLRLVLLGLLAIVLIRPAASRVTAWPAAALAVAITWTFSATGHAATTSPSWVSVPLDMLHLLAMAAWIGGLVLLVSAVLPRREPAELRAVLPVFSTVAFASVVVLVGTGTYAAWRGIGTVDAVFTTTYGLVVLVKVVLFIGLLLLGNWSRRLIGHRAFRPRLAFAMTDVIDAPPAVDEALETERLRRSVLVETGVGLLVLVFSAVLVAQPRGREALAAQYREPVSASAALGDGRSVTVTSDPGTHGTVDLTLELSAGRRPTSLVATATQRAAEIGPIPLRLTREGNGLVYDGAANLPVAGSWRIDLVVTTSAFDATTTDVTLTLH